MRQASHAASVSTWYMSAPEMGPISFVQPSNDRDVIIEDDKGTLQTIRIVFKTFECLEHVFKDVFKQSSTTGQPDSTHVLMFNRLV